MNPSTMNLARRSSRATWRITSGFRYFSAVPAMIRLSLLFGEGTRVAISDRVDNHRFLSSKRLGDLLGVIHDGLILAMTLAGGVARAETIDRVLAVAGGQVILLSDVMAALDLGLVSDDGAADRVGAALAKLINRDLVLVEANRYAPPEPADADVEKELAAVRARFPSTAAFDAVLARSGLTDPQLRVILRENLRIRAVHRAAVHRRARRNPPADADRRVGGRPAPAVRRRRLVRDSALII